ncbi:MAG: hypothetical protein P9L99_10905 [Candidatus Lernaella stagnicola]|nr:hypothetical protein [Candidatus Lernaella stagnicola]
MTPLPSRITWPSRALWAYLACAALGLAIYKWQWLPVSETLYLAILNANLSLTAGVAVVASFLAARRDRLYRVWAVAVALLFAGELLFALLEFVFTEVDNDDLGLTAPTLIWLAARIALIAATAGLWLQTKEERTPGFGRTLAAALGVAVLTLFAVLGVLVPLVDNLAPSSSAAAPFAFVTADMIVLLMAAMLLATGVPLGPYRAPQRFWPVLGFGLYCVGDLFYFRLVALHSDAFCLGELAYFAGYLFLIRGALATGGQPPKD